MHFKIFFDFLSCKDSRILFFIQFSRRTSLNTHFLLLNSCPYILFSHIFLRCIRVGCEFNRGKNIRIIFKYPDIHEFYIYLLFISPLPQIFLLFQYYSSYLHFSLGKTKWLLSCCVGRREELARQDKPSNKK